MKTERHISLATLHLLSPNIRYFITLLSVGAGLKTSTIVLSNRTDAEYYSSSFFCIPDQIKNSFLFCRPVRKIISYLPARPIGKIISHLPSRTGYGPNPGLADLLVQIVLKHSHFSSFSPCGFRILSVKRNCF